ncbi:MAG: hypothetical protein AB7V56_06830 [Candidatus Nitrosocosmicus sp.]
MGFKKLNLKCSVTKSSDKTTKSLVICNTSLENSNRRPIKIEMVYLLFIKKPKSLSTFIDSLEKRFDQNDIDVFDKNLINLLEKRGEKEQDSDRIEDLENGNYLLIPLPYYYSNNARLGSHEYLSFSSHLWTDDHGLFDVYFIVKGKNSKLSMDHAKNEKAIHDLIDI